MFFTCDRQGEKRVLTCVAALLPVNISRGDRLPNENELTKYLESYINILQEHNEEANTLHIEFFQFHSTDCVFKRYVKTILNLLCTISNMIKQHKKDNPEDILFSVQAEKGFSILHQVSIAILLDFSWNKDWQSLEEKCVEELLKLFQNSSMFHYLTSYSLWIKLIVSLLEYQTEKSNKKDQNIITPENFLNSLYNSNENKDHNEISIDYQSILDKTLEIRDIQEIFNYLFEILKYPFFK